MASYTWNYMSTSMIEHVAKPVDEDPWQMPICGARLDPRQQIVRDRPSGIGRPCKRCAQVLAGV